MVDAENIGFRFGGLRFVRDGDVEQVGWELLDGAGCSCLAAALFDWMVDEGHVIRLRVGGWPWAGWWFSPSNPVFTDVSLLDPFFEQVADLAHDVGCRE